MPFNGQRVGALFVPYALYLLGMQKQREKRKKQTSFFFGVHFSWQSA
jgi:hypothetical protein